MQKWTLKKQILLIIWANFPFFLQFLNSLVNRRKPIGETIDVYLNWLIVINLAVMLIAGIYLQIKRKKEEQYLLESDNRTWNERMNAKYENWQNG